MSVTNTQLIHRTVSTTTMTTSSNSSPLLRSFLVPSGSESEDKGLVMRLDGKMDGGRAVGSTPVPAKLCGQSKAVAQWALWTWTLEIHKVSGGFQRFWNRILPVLLCVGVLVLSTQVVVVLYLLTNSSSIIEGAWFLLVCIGIMCYYYVSTLLQGLKSSSSSSRGRTPSSSSLSSKSASPTPSPTSSPPPSPTNLSPSHSTNQDQVVS